MLTVIALASVLMQADDHPRGLYVSLYHWYYFPNKPVSDSNQYEVQSVVDGRPVRIWDRGNSRSLAKNANFEFFGDWRIKSYGIDVERKEMKGDAFFLPNQKGVQVRFQNTLGSIKYTEQLHYAADTTIDFFSGNWKGHGVEITLSQDGKSVKGTLTQKNGEFVLRGERSGVFAEIQMVEKERNRKVGDFILCWNPTPRDLKLMFDGKPYQCSRISLIEYVSDKGNVTVNDIERQ